MATPSTVRVHTVTWEDPERSKRDAASVSGLEYLQALKDGRADPAPVARLLGYRIAEVEPGRAMFEMPAAEFHYNPFATVHGGIMSTLLDTAMTAAVLSTLGPGFSCSTLEMKVNFVRPVTVRTGVLRCEAKNIHVGSTVATSEGRIEDQQGKLYAHAVSTSVILNLATPSSRAPASRP